MINPLDQTGVLFNFAGTNARVQARNGKDGPIYRISFEVDQSTGELFMGANLVGKIYGGQLMLIDPEQGDPTPPDPTPAEASALKGGSVSRDADLLCKNREFQEYVHSLTGQTPCEDEATYHLKLFCLIKSRKELDDDSDAFQRFLARFKDYGAWRKKKVGWSDHAQNRQQQLSADIEAFLSNGGQISEHAAPELDQPQTYQVTIRELHDMTLFADQKASRTAPETVTRRWNPVAVPVHLHDE